MCVCVCLCSGQCWCVDEDGEYVPDSLSGRSLPLVKCELTHNCRQRHTHTYKNSGKKIVFVVRVCVVKVSHAVRELKVTRCSLVG